jgi:uncharacterized protein with NAD-binding domain and iron-sulfur cluster
MSGDAVIIGGGLAGLAAAVELTAQGVSVTVIEKASIPGGKLSGFRDADGDSIEHGFHGGRSGYGRIGEGFRL